MQIVSNTGNTITIVQDGSLNLNFLATSLNVNGVRVLTRGDIGSIIPYTTGVMTAGFNAEMLGGSRIGDINNAMSNYLPDGGWKAGTAQTLVNMINALPTSNPVDVATQSTNGLMSATDKVKIDSIVGSMPLPNTGFVTPTYRGMYDINTVYNNGDTVTKPTVLWLEGCRFPTSNTWLTTIDNVGTSNILMLFKDGKFYPYAQQL